MGVAAARGSTTTTASREPSTHTGRQPVPTRGAATVGHGSRRRRSGGVLRRFVVIHILKRHLTSGFGLQASRARWALLARGRAVREVERLLFLVQRLEHVRQPLPLRRHERLFLGGVASGDVVQQRPGDRRRLSGRGGGAGGRRRRERRTGKGRHHAVHTRRRRPGRVGLRRACARHGESGQQILCVAGVASSCSLSRGMFALRTLLTEHLVPYEFDQNADVAQPQLLKSLVGFAYELVDASLVTDDVGFEVVEVEDLCTLGLREHEVQEKKEAEPRVKGDPADDEDGPRFKEEGEVEDGEVDQPWVSLGRVVGS